LSLRKARPQTAQIFYDKKVLNMPKAMSSFGPDGGIVSTVHESLAFLRAFLDGTLFPANYLEEMKQWKRIFFPLQYGHGLMRFKLPRIFSPFQASPEFIGHSGASSSFLFYCPDEDLYLAGTLNQVKEQSRPFRLMIDVIKALK
jgi:CubicO group peptidase (beta-lactamase class C family)